MEFDADSGGSADVEYGAPETTDDAVDQGAPTDYEAPADEDEDEDAERSRDE